jgi:hypothetical protein
MPEPTQKDRDPHFIGWLPMPRSYVKLLVPAALVVVVVGTIVAGIVAKGHPTPGPGAWENDHLTTLEGIVYATPYPMIRIPGPSSDDPAVTVLLVDEGKHGATDRTRSFDGRPVRVSGTVLRRDRCRMLELASGENAIQSLDIPDTQLAHLRLSAPVSLGRVTLRGEIVDAKCYLGAMRPGDGPTHRGCAVLCLKGGIPPLFVTRGGGSGVTTYLPVGENLGSLPEGLLELAGRTVEAEADVERHGDVLVIRLDPKRIHVAE